MAYNPYLFNYGYYPPVQQPIVEPQPQQYQQVNSQPVNQDSYIIWVQGEAGAKSYPVARGTTLPLFDTEGDFVYFKSVDNNGIPMPLVTMRLVKVEKEVPSPVVEQSQIDLTNYVTKEKYQELENRVLELETRPQTTVTSNFTGNTFNNKKGEK